MYKKPTNQNEKNSNRILNPLPHLALARIMSAGSRNFRTGRFARNLCTPDATPPRPVAHPLHTMRIRKHPECTPEQLFAVLDSLSAEGQAAWTMKDGEIAARITTKEEQAAEMAAILEAL